MILDGHERAARARTACGRGTHYELGTGGRRPGNMLPGGASKKGHAGLCCDCSGFVCWVHGLDRYQPRDAYYGPHFGGWISTRSLVADGRDLRGLWMRVATPLAGDVLVYQASPVGHCSIVVDVGADASRGLASPGMRIVHCSPSNEKRHGDAIAETGVDAYWAHHGAVFLRLAPPGEPTGEPHV